MAQRLEIRYETTNSTSNISSQSFFFICVLQHLHYPAIVLQINVYREIEEERGREKKIMRRRKTEKQNGKCQWTNNLQNIKTWKASWWIVANWTWRWTALNRLFIKHFAVVPFFLRFLAQLQLVLDSLHATVDVRCWQNIICGKRLISGFAVYFAVHYQRLRNILVSTHDWHLPCEDSLTSNSVPLTFKRRKN